MNRIAIFASGTGSNAQKIVEHLASPSQTSSPKERGKTKNLTAGVTLIVSNKSDAGVLKIAQASKIPTLIIDKEKFFRGNGYAEELKNAGIGLIVLAGFLWKIPVSLINAYPKKIINIHPALLPNYGGKGMYGHFVHEAVIRSGDKESGITIHYVDEIYDHGQIILQVKCLVSPADTAETLAKKVQALEHRHFPPAVALLATL
jgi:phosphoribosylglycinamide formyltransferase-1